MDGQHVGKQLLHVDIHIDKNEPRKGILNLLSSLRPHWKSQDIQMKVCEHLISVFRCTGQD